MALPKFLKNYFWDVNFSTLDSKQYPYFILERILEYGDKKALSWMMQCYPRSILKKVVVSSRSLDHKSARFWALILNIDKNKILCLKKSSLAKQSKIWPY